MRLSPVKKKVSPIRDLETRSPKAKKLMTILEEDRYEIKNPSHAPFQANSETMHSQIMAGSMYSQSRPQNRSRIYADEHRNEFDYSHRAYDNQFLYDKPYLSESLEIQKLNKQLTVLKTENDALNKDKAALKSYYESQYERINMENKTLKQKLLARQEAIHTETVALQERYQKIADEDIGQAKQFYINDLKKVMQVLESTKSLLSEKQREIRTFTDISQRLSNEHNENLQVFITENNLLRNKVLQTELTKDNEIHDAEVKKQLQKSRTIGIFSHCKQNNAYLQKQINKLAEQLLEKNISIQSFTREVIRHQRNFQTAQRKHEEKLLRMQEQSNRKIKEIQVEMTKLEQQLQQQISESKRKQLQLLQKIADHEDHLQNKQRQLLHERDIVIGKNREIEELKINVSRMHEDHEKQIDKVRSDSKSRNRSMKNLSEISSMRELSADNNSGKRSIQRRDSGALEDAAGEGGQLYTVHEEMVNSQLVPGGCEDEDLQIKQLVIHYQSIIGQLKNNKQLQLNFANERIEQLNESLKRKQQQMLEILQRFSPLMQYKLNQQSLQSERKKKIEQHYKADIDILSVILDKNRIAALPRK